MYYVGRNDETDFYRVSDIKNYLYYVQYSSTSL